MSNGMLRIANHEISYEQAKDMLFPELIPQKGNEAILSDHPHDKVEDMAVVYRLDLHSEDGIMMSARVNQSILDAFGVSAEQMKKDALEHAPSTHPATFRSMEEVLGAQMALADAGIKLYAGVQGSADKAAQALAAGELEYDPDVNCDYHGHNHDGECSHGSCAEHHCYGN